MYIWLYYSRQLFSFQMRENIISKNILFSSINWAEKPKLVWKGTQGSVVKINSGKKAHKIVKKSTEMVLYANKNRQSTKLIFGWACVRWNSRWWYVFSSLSLFFLFDNDHFIQLALIFLQYSTCCFGITIILVSVFWWGLCYVCLFPKEASA